VLAGPERKTLVMSEHDKLVTAYHEAGHAIVGHVLAHADPIHKVSIVARSRSLGLTFTLPEDRYNHSRSQLRDSMAMCLGGRTAEELAFAEPTTGAENDIEKVTRIARAMVTEYGMSDALGPQQLGQREGEVFLGRELTHQTNYSQEVAAVVDREVRRLIDEAHDRARAVLSHHRSTLDLMARELVERETLDAMDLEGILGPLEAWPVAGPVPDRPPIRTGRGAGRGIPIPVGGAEPADPPAVPDVRPPRRRPLVTPGRAVPVARTQAAPPPAAPPPVRAVPVARTQAAPPPVRAVPVARSQAAPPARRPTPRAGAPPPPARRSIPGTAGTPAPPAPGPAPARRPPPTPAPAAAPAVSPGRRRTASPPARISSALPRTAATKSGAKGASSSPAPRSGARVPKLPAAGSKAAPAAPVKRVVARVSPEDVPLAPRRGRARPKASEP